MPYTENQRRAIDCIDSNLQIVACAGSGKTQVISERVVEILKEKGILGVEPRNIVAFTFTDKAAAELKDRIATLVRRDFGDLPGMAEMYVGTIHGFCLEVLQQYLFQYLKYGVLTEVQSRLLVSRNSRKSGLTDLEVIAGPSIGQKLTRGSHDVKLFLEVMNVLREDNVTWNSVPAKVRDALGKYTDLLDDHRYLDYSRIMLDAVTSLHDDSDECIRLQRMMAERVKYLIVDEYQDVNPLQESLVRRLHELGANVCVVGDDDQTIYQWRGSEIRNILEFAQRYESVESITLAENFRSSRGVVDTGRRIAELNTARLPKQMVPGSPRSFERGDLLALTFANAAEEAAWIAAKILETRGLPFRDEPDSTPRGLSWSDCAILLRSVRQNGQVITDALDAAGIPFLITGLANLFDAPEVQACVAAIAYVNRQVEADDVRNAWNVANLGLTDDDINRGLAVLDEGRNWQPTDRWSTFNIQRLYLSFLEAIALREERVPPTARGASRGELAFYNLGKFSQVISDFEQIHFQSAPEKKYETFLYWLQNDAPNFYEEGGEDVGYAQPDAVQIMTIHQAKGMEWPVVFVPALIKNRFPSTAGSKGRGKWHIIPRAAVQDPQRYDGGVEDERRLFYVAITRSKKYLFCSFAPVAGNKLYKQVSRFFQEFIGSPHVLTAEPQKATIPRLEPRAKRETPNVVLSFSELKYFFECPYSFKLRFLYGFNAPLHEALGYGKSLHDTLSEVHKRAMDGDFVSDADAAQLVDQHLHTPFAYPALKEQLRASAIESVERYLRRNGETLAQTIHSEQQVEIQVAPGITVNGRIDLIKRLDTAEVAIVDFKSTERAQAEDVTRAQLHTYAIGYRQLTGENADLVEILNLDEAGKNVREMVDNTMLISTEQAIRRAGDAIRDNSMARLDSWCNTCATCDLVAVCRTREA
jgi:DNA helicase-2/ATP-dependent DNA helicase PcrA